MKNILITTDFSENAVHASHYVMNLFQYETCTFHMLHVVKSSSFISDDLMNLSSSSSLYSQLIESEKMKLDKEIERLKNRTNNILHTWVPIVDYDNLIGAIRQCVEKNNMDVIVMGTQGGSSSVKKLFGSNTLRVIENFDLPVLAIPESSKIKPIQKVLFTTNLQHNYSKQNLKFLVEMIEKYNHEVHVLHITDSKNSDSNKQEIKQQLDTIFKNTTHNILDISTKGFLSPVLDYIHEHQIDLFSMVSRQHAFFEKLFNEQKIEKIANNLTIPFLTLPMKTN